MIDPPIIPRDVDIVVAGFVSAVVILLLGLFLTVPFAGAQTVPFDGRIDPATGVVGSYSLRFGVFSGYQPPSYARIEWTPTSTGIFCGFETKMNGESGTDPIDVTMSGDGIMEITWSDHEPGVSGTVEGFYLWPEECVTYASGTTYSFNFSTTNGRDDSMYLYGSAGTSSVYEQWQYNGPYDCVVKWMWIFIKKFYEKIRGVCRQRYCNKKGYKFAWPFCFFVVNHVGVNGRANDSRNDIV